MTPKVLPAMISLRNFRHREHDVPGLFFTDDRAVINLVKTLADCKYSATWGCWSVPHKELFLQSVQKLFKLDSFSPERLALLSGTSAASPTPDYHTGRSALEELAASALLRGRTAAETGKDQLEIIFSGSQIFIRLLSLIQSPLDQFHLLQRFSKKPQE